jgi:hypothetical protein
LDDKRNQKRLEYQTFICASARHLQPPQLWTPTLAFLSPRTVGHQIGIENPLAYESGPRFLRAMSPGPAHDRRPAHALECQGGLRANLVTDGSGY